MVHFSLVKINMKNIHNKYYYRPCYKIRSNNSSFKYRLIYCGSCVYQLTRGKYKVIFKTYSFKSMYDFIKRENIDLNEIHLPYMTLFEFLRDWVSFDDDEVGGF